MNSDSIGFEQRSAFKNVSFPWPESEEGGLDDPVEEGPLLQGVEVAVRDCMTGSVGSGMFF
jgi:hypothetical protein